MRERDDDGGFRAHKLGGVGRAVSGKVGSLALKTGAAKDPTQFKLQRFQVTRSGSRRGSGKGF